jgi:hypothetical protein
MEARGFPHRGVVRPTGSGTAAPRGRPPATIAARLLPGVVLNGRRIGESDRVVHLLSAPTGTVLPDRLHAYCGQPFAPGQAEIVGVGRGMPCVACLAAAPSADA